jgi:hypothetical protein
VLMSIWILKKKEEDILLCGIALSFYNSVIAVNKKCYEHFILFSLLRVGNMLPVTKQRLFLNSYTQQNLL